MQYSMYDLGFIKAETIVTVTLSSAANVHLMDSANYLRYSRGDVFHAYGGCVKYSPLSFTVPFGGHWYVTVDLGGYEGKVRHSVLIEEPQYNGNYDPINWQVQDDNDDYRIKVTSRYLEKNPQYGAPNMRRTDMLVFDKETGKHIHLSIDDEGNITNWHRPRK